MFVDKDAAVNATFVFNDDDGNRHTVEIKLERTAGAGAQTAVDATKSEVIVDGKNKTDLSNLKVENANGEKIANTLYKVLEKVEIVKNNFEVKMAKADGSDIAHTEADAVAIKFVAKMQEQKQKLYLCI